MEKDPRPYNLGRLNRKRTKVPLNKLHQQFTFQCRYPAILTGQEHYVPPRDFPRKGTNAYDYGKLDPGFVLGLFNDREYTRGLDDWNKATYIGSKIYGQVNWLLSSLKRVQFHIDRCEIDINGNKVNIIQQNCYLKIFGTRLESKSHLQTQTSNFSFNSFTTKQKTFSSFEQKERIRCDIHLCLVGKCPIVSNDKCLKQRDYGFDYSIDGQ